MIAQCPTCEARFIDGQYYSALGKPANALDLAGLVCNPYSRGRQCINPCHGKEGGQTFNSRWFNSQAVFDEHDIEFDLPNCPLSPGQSQ